MADVSVNIGVSGISQFKQGMSEAKESIKTLDAALKANEKAVKATGDAEGHLAAQTTLLNAKIQQQKNIIKNAEQALKQMSENGVRESSREFQKMQRTLIEAQSGLMDTEQQLDQLGAKETETAEKTDKLASSLGGLNKKVSLEQVTSAIDKITGGMEKAAAKAIDFGKQLWDTIMDSAKRADDTATMAEMYGIDLQEFKKMQKLVGEGMDTTVESMLTAQDKLNKGIGKGTKEVKERLEELGISLQTWATVQGQSGSSLITRDAIDVFWEAGQAIMAMGDAYDKEAAAQALFGRSWKELVPLFNKYHSAEEYKQALEGVDVSSEEATRNLAELNDAVMKLESTWTELKDEMLGAIAPALNKAADALSGLLGNIMDYLKTPEGKQALEDMGKAVEGLFEDLSKIDPQEVVSGFSEVFTTIVNGLKWLSENSGTLVGVLETVVVGWGALKLTGGALEIYKLIQGIMGLTGAGGAASAAASAAKAGSAAGGSWATAFASAVMKVLPFALPFLFGADSIIRGIEQQNEAAEKGQQSYQEYKTEQQAYQGGEMYDIWDTLMRWKTPTGTPEDHNVLENFAERWAKWWNEDVEDAALQKLADSMTDEDFLQVNDVMQKIFGGGEFASEEDRDALLEAVDKAIDAAKKLMDEEKLELPTQLDVETTADDIAKEVGTVNVPVSLVISGGIGSLAGKVNFPGHANGIEYVPFDGYTAVLHKGERVVTAREREAASRNYSSNLYVESMYMNNNTDAEGLAAAMAAAQRRTMAGYGS